MFAHSWPIHLNLGFILQFECGIMDIINAIIAILGFVFAIYQFTRQNQENRKSNIEQNNKNWYLSVLVIPQLERINLFFEETVGSLKTLKDTIDNTDLLLRAKEQRVYNEKISAFFSPLEASFASYNETLRKSISDLGLALQDEVTKIVGEEGLDNTEIERRIMSFKGLLISIMYRPINN